MAGRVCIVSPGNLASNPRALKEADALHRAGYQVTSIACDYTEALRGYDDEIARSTPWKIVRVPRPTSERYLGRAGRVAAKAFAALGLNVPLAVAAAAHGGPVWRLKEAACAEPADLYIAHYIAALPAAAAAAGRHGAFFGFDAEDFHSGEGTGGAREAFRMKVVECVEAATLPTCSYMTAASPMIGSAYARRYGVSPATVLNVFPLAMAPVHRADSTHSPSGELSVYWFSQTIGLDRGLQAFLQAMSIARSHVSLDIRGSNRWGHGDTLMALAAQLGIAERVRLLPVAPPDDMIKLASDYDLGLSLETDISENRRICLTNKIFTYLLAGIPVMMSDTPAQAALAPDLGAASRLISLADPEHMAHELDRLASSTDELRLAKDTSHRLGRERYNWEVEKGVLLAAVESTLGQRARKHG